MHSDRSAFIYASIFGVFVVLLSSSIALAPRLNHSVAVIVSPLAERHKIVEVIVKAGGVIKSQDKLSWIAITQNESAGLVNKLYDSGALLVIDASVVSACLKLQI